MTIKLEFSEEEIKVLDRERYHHPHPNIRKRMEVLYLKSQQFQHQQIRQICGISKSTLSKYLKQYKTEGIEGLKQLNYKGQPSQLHQHTAVLQAHFDNQPPATVAQARAEIEELTGLKRSPTQVRAYLKDLGLRYLKNGAVPGKANDPDKQAEQAAFEQEQLQPRLVEAKAGQRAVFLWMRPTLFTAPS